MRDDEIDSKFIAFGGRYTMIFFLRIKVVQNNNRRGISSTTILHFFIYRYFTLQYKSILYDQILTN